MVVEMIALSETFLNKKVVVVPQSEMTLVFKIFDIFWTGESMHSDESYSVLLRMD